MARPIRAASSTTRTRAAGAIADRGRDLARDAAAEDPWDSSEFPAVEIAPEIAADALIEIEIEPRPIRTVPETPGLEDDPFEDPAVARRRAEVLGAEGLGAEGLGEVEVAASDSAAPEFMTPRERQRELDALAEDMELLFVDKIGR